MDVSNMTVELSDTERSLIREGLDCVKYMLYNFDYGTYSHYSEETKEAMFKNCILLKVKLTDKIK